MKLSSKDVEYSTYKRSWFLHVISPSPSVTKSCCLSNVSVTSNRTILEINKTYQKTLLKSTKRESKSHVTFLLYHLSCFLPPSSDTHISPSPIGISALINLRCHVTSCHPSNENPWLMTSSTNTLASDLGWVKLSRCQLHDSNIELSFYSPQTESWRLAQLQRRPSRLD